MAHVSRSRRPGSFNSSSPRRQTSWTAGPGGIITQSATGKTLFGTGIVPTIEGLTIARLRGEAMFSMRSAGSAADSWRGAVGMALVTDEAFAVGVTAVPGPLTDIDFDEWMWWSAFQLTAAIGAVASDEPSYPLTQAIRIPIDNKAMRKFPVGKTLVCVAEATEVGGTVFDASVLVRSLVFLP